MVDAATLEKLEAGFAKLAASDSKSLLKKYLTKEVFDALKNKKTPSFGSTLLDCVQSGFENHDSGVGIYAPDAESYSVFSDLFDPIIEDYHFGFKKTDKHPASFFGDVSVFGNVDPTGEYVVSTRVRCGRSMQGYAFNPCLTEEQYKEMEGKVAPALQGLDGELKGKFYPLTGMDKAVQQQLIDDHFLFKEGEFINHFIHLVGLLIFWCSRWSFLASRQRLPLLASWTWNLPQWQQNFLGLVQRGRSFAFDFHANGRWLGTDLHSLGHSRQQHREAHSFLTPRPSWFPHILPNQSCKCYMKFITENWTNFRLPSLPGNNHPRLRAH